MPIVNAAYSNWTKSMMSLPQPTGDGGAVWLPDEGVYTGQPRAVVTSEFRIQRLVDLKLDTSVHKGQPWGHLWNVGDAVWQIDFNSPFLIYLHSEDINLQPWSGLQVFDYFLRQCVRVLPTSGANFQDLWERKDFIVKSVSLKIDEDQATVAVSIITTIDPRPYFYQQGYANFEQWGARLCKPYDLKIPVLNMMAGQTKNCIGGPMNIYEDRTAYSYPMRTPAHDPDNELGTLAFDYGHISLVRSIEVNVQSEVTQFDSVGSPSSRPLLGVKSIKCDGSMDYVPLVRNSTGVTIVSSLPEGWIPDMQSLEYVRNGGQLFVAGHPPYTPGGGFDPLWVGLALDTVMTQEQQDDQGVDQSAVTGEVRGDPILLFDPKWLGPVMVASYTSSTSPNQPLSIKVDFQTNVGVTSFDPQEN